MVCSRSNDSESLIMILERLMVADMFTSAPNILQRANKTLNVQIPFRCASSKSASLILFSKALLVVNRLFQERATQQNSRNAGASGLYPSVGNVHLCFISHPTASIESICDVCGLMFNWKI